MMNQIFCILLLIPTSMQAQSAQKIGHADWEYIFSHMPEYKQIQIDLKTYETQLQNQLKLKSQEFEARYKSFQSLPADTPEAIHKDKESELAICKRTSKISGAMHRHLSRKNNMNSLHRCSQKWGKL